MTGAWASRCDPKLEQLVPLPLQMTGRGLPLTGAPNPTAPKDSTSNCAPPAYRRGRDAHCDCMMRRRVVNHPRAKRGSTRDKQ
ncbi:MAG: hypothetical protein ACK53Y_06070, partial [bacterium]